MQRYLYNNYKYISKLNYSIIYQNIKKINMSTSSSSSNNNNEILFKMDSFCLRQFESDYNGASLHEYDPLYIQNEINNRYHNDQLSLCDGYAPFCKHIFIPNFLNNIYCPYIKINDNNKNLLKTKYEARTEQELPILLRYFDKNDFVNNTDIEEATYLDVILYSREQIIKENEAMGKEIDDETAPWGIISIKAQTVDHELPMQPITMMRNALGKEEGGSGVPLERNKYLQSVEFWSQYAILR